ncbi:MAG: geranylgeranylglyceryl/heptaprenylglyceryl phosphate synthase [Flavobacteriales bacterium]|nr:geranylgeranylglyceryl/heptaprenylglyceryl phosphate synthase [Flavobacteriales bacterium]MCX7649651.1 geranylgeranylglyceryl/heptaprenylglyceryl phosphate synthase [Flavobacteriales bacterium]MDW8432168.1 geranylgeranylglyceryl/heptaprenylglyceryl phosphate synthase [Flavobacteriales bacterium]
MNLRKANVYEKIVNAACEGKKKLAILIDPDKTPPDLASFLYRAEQAGAGYFFVGGSLLTSGETETLVRQIKSLSSVPVIIFPGNPAQICKAADALLFLSLISGRNPDLLIGRHVEAAPVLKKIKIEVIPTGYILVDCGNMTTASYISQTLPLPHDKPELAAITALAGEMLGLRLIYLDGGSGARKTVDLRMVSSVKQAINVPLIVGGGIQDAQSARDILHAGADIVVVGTALEKNPDFLAELSPLFRS